MKSLVNSLQCVTSVCLMVFAISVSSCRPTAPYVWVKDFRGPPQGQSSETLRPGDHVFVVVRGQDAYTGDFEIRPGGELVIPVIGPTPAVGLTLIQLSAAIRAKMEGLLDKPQVSVVFSSHKTKFVSVMGEVKSPGRYELGMSEGVLQILARAGGLGQFADEDSIYVVRAVSGWQRVRFRYSDLTGSELASTRFGLADGDVVIVE